MELEQEINCQYNGPGNPTQLVLDAVKTIVTLEQSTGEAIETLRKTFMVPDGMWKRNMVAAVDEKFKLKGQRTHMRRSSSFNKKSIPKRKPRGQSAG
jgi:hypothetical protein